MKKAAAKGRRFSLLAAVCLLSPLLLVPTAEASRTLTTWIEPVLSPPAIPDLVLEASDAEPQPRHRLFGDLSLLERPLDVVPIQKTASGVFALGIQSNIRQTGGLEQNRSGPTFQGLWTDPVTGIAYARNRWYDARTASWLSEDPLGAVDSPNLYSFVAWAPQSARDPMGAGICDWTGNSTCLDVLSGAGDMIGESLWNALEKNRPELRRGAAQYAGAGGAYIEYVLQPVALQTAGVQAAYTEAVVGLGVAVVDTSVAAVSSSASEKTGGDVRLAGVADSLSHPIDTITGAVSDKVEHISGCIGRGDLACAQFGIGELTGQAEMTIQAVEGAARLTTRMVVGRFETVANAMPARMARVVDARFANSPRLAGLGAEDVFVTAADEIAGVTSSSELASRLTLIDDAGNFRQGPFAVIEFDTPASGVASPVFRTNPGFVQGARTAGGAVEFVLPNLDVSQLGNVTVRIVQ